MWSDQTGKVIITANRFARSTALNETPTSLKVIPKHIFKLYLYVTPSSTLQVDVYEREGKSAIELKIKHLVFWLATFDVFR